MNGARLKQARELRRWVQEDLALAAGVSQSTIARLEVGSLEPSADLLSRLAEATGFSERFLTGFDLVEIPEGSFVHYRSRRSKLTAADRAYVRSLSQLAVTLHVLLSAHFKSRRTTLPHLEGETDIEDAVRMVRAAIGAKALEPIPRLVFHLEKAGVVCLSLPTPDLGDFDGFSAWVGSQPIIIFNGTQTAERLRMTAAHELAHLCWPSAIQGSVRTTEEAANDFASHFLLPSEGVQPELPHPITISGLSDLKLRWGVSIHALIVRAQRLGLVDERRYKGLLIRHKKLWPGVEPESTSLPPERPRALSKMNEVVHDGSASQLAKSLGCPVWLVAHTLGVHGSRSDLTTDARSARVVSFPAPASPSRKKKATSKRTS